ncbi:NitT/TauT family transport system substrate-binding protein [Roseovarius pacificus]|uniref:NitT/TauT family transport system substrate-binding protein n=1 Tax=Roseovarius pacificus TaxID=337701 RepID=A0A1M7A3Y4_9RHOB|nr:ABC transporter substrate-binding protein [Roseovarius pacificus]GGO53932.1 ABC transporter substrate-binding protein [Roseovarius pacificus]SHL37253.1 NitT/TauT family transport system substrate-binding protein [Roseovarius pacificus]
MTITRRQFGVYTGALGLSSGLGFSVLGSRSARAQDIRFEASSGMPVKSISYVAQDIAIANGYLAEEGMELEIINAGGGSNLRDLVGSRQIEFGVADSAHPLKLTSRNRPAKILLSLDSRSPLVSIVIRQELYDQGIDSLEKLAEWKRPDGSAPNFGVTSLGGGQHTYLSYLAEKKGIEDRFTWLAGGGESTILGGLSTGQFDAIASMPNLSFISKERNWGQVVFDVSDDQQWADAFGGEVPSTVGFCLQETIEENPEMVQAYVNGMYRALKWLNESSVDEIYEAVAPLYLGDFDEETIRREIEFLEPIHSKDGAVQKDQFANLAPILFREMTAMSEVSYEDAVDTTFLEKARQEYGG